MAEQSAMPTVGDSAPRIQGEITGNGDFDLADQQGMWVVVYFFPRANTPG